MELVREIIVPTSNSYTLTLPDEMVGQQVEVIAFKVENSHLSSPAEKTKTDQIKDIKAIFKDSLVDLSGFKFDRDEANNYDE